MKKLIATMGLLCLYFAVLLLILHIVGTDGTLYHRLQLRADVLSEAGIGDQELIAADNALARYLAGDASALKGSPFGADELSHMEDCYGLFVLLRRVMLIAFALSAVLIFAARRAGLRDFLLPSLAASGILLLFTAALAIWGIIDFTSLFTAMHHVLFSNGLWLMDWDTQLMIRICPESMFSTMALIIGSGFAVFLIFMNCMCGIFRGRHK